MEGKGVVVAPLRIHVADEAAGGNGSRGPPCVRSLGMAAVGMVMRDGAAAEPKGAGKGGDMGVGRAAAEEVMPGDAAREKRRQGDRCCG